MNQLLLLLLLLQPPTNQEKCENEVCLPQAPPVVKPINQGPPQAPPIKGELVQAPPIAAPKIKVFTFGNKRCIHCVNFKPLFTKFSMDYSKHANFSEVDTDLNQVLPKQYGIMAYPTVVIDDGKRVIKHQGAITQEQLENWIGIKTSVSYTDALKMATKGQNFILAVGVNADRSNDFGSLPVYNCADSAQSVDAPTGYYRCFNDNGTAKWLKIK